MSNLEKFNSLNFKDKNGKLITYFDSVEVPEPNDTYMHNYSFVGTAIDEHAGCVVVEDGEGETFCIEPERLSVYTEEHF